ncbi:hypothetical protein [Phreatobacter stygius]|uniref:Uncharacterized protein n=1 Tax=Phreatobacter stygius TaxID=1940610 RepID=A0A4D7B7N8_9HYPH|nr:hypothetical protein [Phreatobacter stygius]QCI66893.1 hypothetical protein E8M01_23180 [Phreatobacter stygius]
MFRNRTDNTDPGVNPWRSAAWLGALLLAGVPMIQARPAFGQVTIEEALAGSVMVRARVADVFGDRILVEDGTGRILVELAAAADRPAAVEAGQILVIEGRLRGRVLEARRVTLAGSEAPGRDAPAAAAVPAIQPGTDALTEALTRPADIATMRAALEAIGFRTAGSPVRHEKSTEIPVRDARGRAWVASLDRFGRLEEIEIADYDDDNAPDRPSFTVADVGRMVEREGFRPRASAERRSHHFEILVLNSRSELIELHIDFAGLIYKLVWVR